LRLSPLIAIVVCFGLMLAFRSKPGSRFGLALELAIYRLYG